MDRLENCRGGGEWQAGAAILLGDQRRQVAGLGEGADELGRILPLSVQLTPVVAGEAGAEFRDFLADFGVRVGGQGLVHFGLPRRSAVA